MKTNLPVPNGSSYMQRKAHDTERNMLNAGKSNDEIRALIESNKRLEQLNREMRERLEEKLEGLKITPKQFYSSKIFKKFCKEEVETNQ